MKKIDAHLHLAKIVAGYCRRGELRAIGGGKCQWGSGEVFQLFQYSSFSRRTATMAMTASQLSRLWRSWTATMWRELF